MNRGRSIFYRVVAIVVGVLAYPVSGTAWHRLGPAGPVVVTLIAGLALGLLSRSLQIALLSSWFVAVVGGISMASSTLGTSPGHKTEPSSLLSGALLIGGPAGAAAGGYLGARLRGVREAIRPGLPQHPAVVAIAGALFIFGIVLGPGGPGGSTLVAHITWFAGAIATAIWFGLRPVVNLRAVKRSVWVGLALILAALLCWPVSGWIIGGLIGGIFLFLLPIATFVLGFVGLVVGLVARHRATAETGRRIASLTAVAGGLLVLAIPVFAVYWFAASMYSCYAVMC